MCEPTLLVALTIGASGASGLFSAGSQMRQGERQGRLAIWQALQESKAGFDEAAYVGAAQVDEFRDVSQATVDQATRATRAYSLASEIARRNAEAELAKSNFEENRVREETGRQLAQQSTYFAANNMDPTYGSPLALAAFGAAQGETDARIVRANGLQGAAEQQWGIYGLADRASETADAAAASVGGSAKALKRTIDSSFRTAGIRGTGANTAATISASNARKAGQYGAATTLVNTASSWISLAGGGKLKSIGIPGL
jgi:hypothetical protein